ncbi:MAG: GntR family transcriptional regulator [Fusobacteriaceae bacterium]
MMLLNSEKNVNETNPQFAYRVIKDNILSLVLRPGDAISETEISKILNISRTPIREALVNLKNETLIDVYPQKGTFVSLLDFTLIEEAEFMRTVLECEVVRLATKYFSEENLKELEHNLNFQKKITEFSPSAFEFFNLDNKFHEIIFRGCNKSNVWEQIKILSSHLNRIRLLDAMEKTSLELTSHQHEDIFNLIKNKDSGENVDKIIKEHVSSFHTQLEELYKKYPLFFKNKRALK